VDAIRALLVAVGVDRATHSVRVTACRLRRRTQAPLEALLRVSLPLGVLPHHLLKNLQAASLILAHLADIAVASLYAGTALVFDMAALARDVITLLCLVTPVGLRWAGLSLLFPVG
jgi:Tfp pilus assembly PilM family ATPase